MTLSDPERTATSHAGSGARYRLDIEALRALAILLVVAYHANVPGFPGGYIGVDVFFVLSGYLITGLLTTEIRSTGRVDFLGFYVRRIRRLLPAAITVVIATLLVGRYVYPPVDHRVLANSGLATSLYVSNLYFARSATDYLGNPDANPLLHTWSLAVEEQFYLFWPAIVLVGFAGLRSRIRQKRLLVTMLVLAAASLSMCVWLTNRSQPWAFFMLPTRAWEFAAGALARMAPESATLDSRRTRALAWIGFAAILVAGTQFGASTVFPGISAVLPVAGTALMLGAGAINASAGPFRLLVNRPMLWLGRLSYSWYLWHWPVLIFGRTSPLLRSTTASVALAVLSLGLAAATHALIENPIRFQPSLRRRPALSVALAVILTSAGAATAVAIRQLGARDAASAGQIIYTQARDLPSIYSDGCHLSLTETRIRKCEYGDTSATSAIVLFGDSHAAQWFPALDSIALEHHLKLVSLTKSGCPSATVDLVNANVGRPYTECTSWREAAIERILALEPIAIVISNYSGYIRVPGVAERWTTSEQAWHEGLLRTAARFDSAGLRSFLLADTPTPGFDVITCLGRVAWNPTLHRETCEFQRTTKSVAISHRIDNEVAAELPSVKVIDLTETICAHETCRAQVGSVVRFRDGNHLSTRFAASLAPVLSDRIVPARPGG
jgi:peptidoglycan/LPS O-acetylase OafA/YrhL